MEPENNNNSTNDGHVPAIPRPAPAAVIPGPLIRNPFDAWAARVRFGVAPARAEFQLRTEFITGCAGTGKTYEVQARRAADPDGVVLAATTGIAAVNLGPEVTTIHSLLKFRDTEALADAYISGRLQQNIRELVDGGMHELIVDEISMFCAPAMDALYNGCHEVAQAADCPQIKLTPVGDFCQLPPVPDDDVPGTDKYALEADCWRPNFSDYTTRLTHSWRQDNVDFIRALQAARRGAGEEALAYLQASGVRFERSLDDAFEGTTLQALNVDVDQYNLRRLYLLDPKGKDALCADSARWGIPQVYQEGRRQPSLWKEIPWTFKFKPGAPVMILTNDCPAFSYANGDCGTIVGTAGSQFVVQLRRNGKDVLIGKITRTITTRAKPTGIPSKEMIEVANQAEYDALVRSEGNPKKVVMLREPRPTWIIGWVTYYPLRLAYASSVHKSQGLSLDAIQLDLSPRFLAQPAMMYVSLSRCRTPGGLVLVGTPEQVVEKTKVDPRVTEWL